MPVRNEVINWLEEAKADLEHAEASARIGDYNWACFAAQQAAEKALKALALHVLGKYLRSHDLVKLYGEIRTLVDLGLSESSLARLSMYYTVARYPNAGVERPSQEISEDQAREAIEIAKVVVDAVSRAIRDP